MPNWSNQLPPSDKGHGYDLKRTPPDRPLKGIITCDDLNICPTHYWGGRTVPCERPNCPACDKNTAIRSHCYVSLLEAGTHDHILFECTAKAAAPLFDWKRTYGTLRGCLIVASRPKRKKNARVEIICKPVDLTKIILPHAPDIKTAMAVIWQIPGDAIETQTHYDGAPQMGLRKEILDAQRLHAAEREPAATHHSGNGDS
jgi:hypothetical protein